MDKEVIERILVNQMTIMTLLAEDMADKEKNEVRDTAVHGSIVQTMLLVDKLKGRKRPDISKLIEEILKED